MPVTSMTRSELIENICEKQNNLTRKDIEFSVKTIIEEISNSLAQGERTEIRGFGSFTLRIRPPRIGRNPKTGESVHLDVRSVPHFKPGKEFRDRVNKVNGKG